MQLLSPSDISHMLVEKDTVNIALPATNIDPSSFALICKETSIDHISIKQLHITQHHYDRYKRSNRLASVTIPDTLANLTQLECISITAFVEELPKCICHLRKLTLLDLSGCYNILSIPSEVLAMPNLKIKIGAVLSPASEVFVIEVPKRKISPDIFNILSDINNRKITQLIIHQRHSSVDAHDHQPDEIIIPDDISIPDGLRCIWLRGNLLRIPSFIFKQKELRTLGISGYFDTVPAILGEMTQLSSLDLSRCKNIQSLPESIGNLSNLTSLNLGGCYFLTRLPESVGNLSKLVSLNLADCRNLISLPQRIGDLSSLTTLNISGCSRLRSLPISIGALTNLTSLLFSITSGGDQEMTLLPDSIGNLSQLTTLDLSTCFNLSSLPESIGNLSNLRSLDLSHCSSLLSLPDSFGNLSHLTSLTLSFCSRLASLPESIGNLSHLTSLTIDGCSNLHDFPSSMQNLTHLTKLILTGCSFDVLPSFIDHLKEMTELDLSGCHRITALPDSIGSLTNLTSLRLGCDRLNHIPSSIGNLSKLQSLKLGGVFETLPSSIGDLTNLTSLTFISCAHLHSFPSSMQNLTHLTTLTFTWCEFETLPSGIEYLKELTALKLDECRNLNSLPETIGSLTHLTSLDLTGCDHLKALPDTLGNLSNLTQLNLKRCYDLQTLPTTLSNLTHLSTPLYLAGTLPLPTDMDWTPYSQSLTVPSYLDCMIRMNKIDSIISSLSAYLERFSPMSYYRSFESTHIPEQSGLILHKGEGGRGMIGYLCSMLTNGGMTRRSGYVNRIMEWSDGTKKGDGMNCLAILYLTVFGMVTMRHRPHNITAGSSMRAAWVDEGKEDDEGRREWERRWREASDIMNEEDVMETSIMHLCIPDDEKKKKDGLIVPSICSYHAMHLLMSKVSHGCASFHFPVYDITDQPSTTVILRNLPEEFDPGTQLSTDLILFIRSISPSASLTELIDSLDTYPVVRVSVPTPDDATLLADQITRRPFRGAYLTATVGKKETAPLPLDYSNTNTQSTSPQINLPPLGGDAQMYCNNCYHNFLVNEIVYHCSECENFDLCQDCFAHTPHPHPLTQCLAAENYPPQPLLAAL